MDDKLCTQKGSTVITIKAETTNTIDISGKETEFSEPAYISKTMKRAINITAGNHLQSLVPVSVPFL